MFPVMKKQHNQFMILLMGTILMIFLPPPARAEAELSYESTQELVLQLLSHQDHTFSIDQNNCEDESLKTVGSYLSHFITHALQIRSGAYRTIDCRDAESKDIQLCTLAFGENKKISEEDYSVILQFERNRADGKITDSSFQCIQVP